MIVEYVKGDLLDAPYTIGHGCNCQGVMGSGVAKAIREKFPKAYSRYRSSYENANYKLHLGDIHFVNCNGKIIINMMTQDNYGRDGHKYVSYDAIHECFSFLDRMSKDRRMSHEDIAIPKIGAGLGGGDWNVIAAIINSVTPNIRIHVYEI